MTERPVRTYSLPPVPIEELVAQCGGNSDFVAWRLHHALVRAFYQTWGKNMGKLVCWGHSAANIAGQYRRWSVTDGGFDDLAERDRKERRQWLVMAGYPAIAASVPLYPSHPPLPPLHQEAT